jgi:hypothetical protein
MNHKETGIWTRFGIGFTADSCEYGKETWDFAKSGELLDRLNKYRFKG